MAARREVEFKHPVFDKTGPRVIVTSEGIEVGYRYDAAPLSLTWEQVDEARQEVNKRRNPHEQGC